MATRMQQRRGTASQWTAANPVLAAGEIGFETDTEQFKMGNGTAAWADLSYFKNLEDLGGSLDDYILLTEKGAANGVATLDTDAQVPLAQLSNLIQNAPEALDTILEIANAIDDPAGIVQTKIDAAILEEAGARDDAINLAISNVQGDLTTAIGSLETELLGAVSTETTERGIAIAALTTDDIEEGNTNKYFTDEKVQDAVAAVIIPADGVTKTYDDTANTLTIGLDATIAPKTYVDTAVSDHNSDTTNVHGILDTSALATSTDISTAVSNHNDDTTNVHGIADTSELATSTDVSTAVSAHNDVTTNVHGIADTSELLTTAGGTVDSLTITGNLTVQGTTTTVDTANLEVTDSLIYLASEQFDTDALDIGIFGAYGDVEAGHSHTGLVRDASDSKWKLVSGGPEPVSNTIDFSSVSYDTLKLGAVEFADGIQTKQGVPSITAINQQGPGSYTTVLTDRDKLVEIATTNGPVTLTIPDEATVAYPIGTSIDILQTGTGVITIQGANNVTVNATPGLKLRTQWSSATLLKRASDTWVVYGDLKA